MALVHISTAISGIVAYLIARTIYRLFFHPLSGFPGPKFAAISFLPEFYYDVIRRGMYIWEVERMHEEYGPIVRINPRELHVKDPFYFDEIYAGRGRVRDKDPAWTVALLTPNAMASTNGHDQHRVRRNILNNFFSKRSVTNLEDVIQEKVNMLKGRLLEAFDEAKILNLPPVFAALTADVITHYCHGASRGYLIAPDFKNNHMEALDNLFTLFHISRFVPPLARILERLPLETMSNTIGELVEIRLQTRRQAAKALSTTEKKTFGTETLFQALTAESVPAKEKTVPRLEDETSVLFGAGTETTARTLSIVGFYLAKNKDLMRQLRDELKQVMIYPDSQPTWSQLEKLPLLSGIIQEALRLSYGLSSRMTRIAPTEDLVYNKYIIPKGSVRLYTLSITIHRFFPNPKKFDPERWIRASRDQVNLKKHMHSFSRGSRQCLGMNLAYAEMYLTLAMFARNFDVDLADTTEENIQLGRDMGLPYPSEGRFCARVRVTGVAKD
ncbi:benzoate 4-monooxygenase cytochrome P450 [Penicillium hetheringtonii]|uniref:Benzoate 4-monooxygenase cytochrome P450 n=1 Tax=Penicillium hetheringtonii TaxID=911720 RepID=A0AAD6GPY1_9EURO|nr:benzoate 4-monooxygenase cytochrome P450 [Penicillium hetheringtonii]